VLFRTQKIRDRSCSLGDHEGGPTGIACVCHDAKHFVCVYFCMPVGPLHILNGEPQF
jgi:hypothetical protein